MKILTIVTIVIILIQSMTIITYEKENDANTNYQEIYVQHDSENNNIYLLKSEGEQTTVYKNIDVTYTPCKQWTRDGLYIDDPTGKVSATSKENYIKVKENEIYFVKLYGIGDVYRGENGNEIHITSPIVYFDDNEKCIGYDLSNECSKSKSGVEITIPSGATRMYISNYNNQDITIQKKITVNNEEFNEIIKKQNDILNSLDSNYEKEKQDKMIYDEFDKCYITFVQDDSRPDIDKFADLFIAKNTPLCFAAVADNLLNMSSSLKETRLEVAKRVQKAGGEILAHSGPVITAETINDENFMYNYFAIQKQKLTNMGFNVNGIILAGGLGQIVGEPQSAKWSNLLYKYSDLLGENYTDLNGYESTYFHSRKGLLNYKNNIEEIKQDIDKAIENKEWKVFYFHDANEITEETLEEVIDYIKSKGKENVEIVTYKTVYDKFAKRESVIKNDVKTYYVSSSGTSNDGTNKNKPINLKTLKSKKIKSGDTILFKRGDVFCETLDISITKLNDKNVKISSYGQGELPTFSAYKYIKNNWEKYSENIYRIDIKDTSNFTGYTDETENAYNIGFLEDDKNNKYYNKKMSIDKLSEKNDFYSDGTQYLYIYSNKNPYDELGNLKVVLKANLMTLHSNMEVDSIRFSYSGGHGLVGADENEENIKISNCIIENIGGSYLYKNKETRYGNGIEFYGCNAKDIIIKDNIIRNIYDVGFTIQGTKGSGTNINVYNNAFISNTQDSEIWENGTATGVIGYKFHHNISVNQGRGWGYEARPDKYAAGHILFWGYNIENTDIVFNNNFVYNPRRIYFIEQSYGTNIFFKENDYIKSNNNTYWMAEDSKIFRDSYKISEKDIFIEEYKKDKDSIFNILTVDNNIIKTTDISSNIKEIRKLFGIEEHTKHLGGTATCTQKAICEVCGDEYGEYLEHEYDEGKITKQATYEEEGEKTYTCKTCTNTKIEILPKLNKQSTVEDEKDEEEVNNKDNKTEESSTDKDEKDEEEINNKDNKTEESSTDKDEKDEEGVNDKDNKTEKSSTDKDEKDEEEVDNKDNKTEEPSAGEDEKDEEEINNKDNKTEESSTDKIDNTISSNMLPKAGSIRRVYVFILLIILIICSIYYRARTHRKKVYKN